MHVDQFEAKLQAWSAKEPGVVAAAIVGSYARNAAHAHSDIDVVILSHNAAHLLCETSWLSTFGEPSRIDVEEWGAITSLRTRYTESYEVEFGISDPAWAHLPPDAGTRRVVSDGIRIVYDPSQLLQRLVADVRKCA